MKYIFILLMVILPIMANDIKLPINQKNVSIIKINNNIYEIQILSNKDKITKQFSLNKEFNLSNVLIKIEEVHEKIKHDLNDNNILILTISSINNTNQQYMYISFN